jgi:hypothetical protein
MSLPTDFESAQGALDHVRGLAARLDLDHPHADYQAQKADQLADTAHQLAHDLRLLARGRRMRLHLVEAHQVVGVPEAAAMELAAWLADHDARHAVSRRPCPMHIPTIWSRSATCRSSPLGGPGPPRQGRPLPPGPTRQLEMERR